MLPAQLQQVSKNNAVLWLGILSAASLGETLYSVVVLHRVVKPAILASFFAALSYGYQAQQLHLNVPVTACLHRRLSNLWVSPRPPGAPP